MIPVRVLVRNFLCFDEAEDGLPVEFDFEGSRLWSISGDNGAGKSAVFDAITYALFGKHRGGGQRDGQLVRKGARSCEVIFEFRLDDELYRVRRTVGRPNSVGAQESKTWQASWFDPTADDWRPIPDTERKAELDGWVKQKIGFGYDTFLASVLLLQGQSDALLRAQPKGRFDILSGLLDLDSYRRLEAAAAERARAAKTQTQQLEQQVSSLPAVSEQDLTSAQKEVAQAKEIFEQANASLTQAQQLLTESSRHARLKDGLAEAQAALEAQKALLVEADRIRAENEESRELQTAVPKLRDALNDLQAAATCLSSASEARSQAAVLDLTTLADAVATAHAAVKQGGTLVRRLSKESTALAETLGPLRALLDARANLAQRESHAAQAGTAIECKAALGDLKARTDALRKELDSARGKVDDVRNTKAAADAELTQAQGELEAREAAGEEAVCSRCGQSVDPQHIKKELTEAKKVIADARKRVQQGKKALENAERGEADLQKGVRALEKDVTAAQLTLAAALAADTELKAARSALAKASKATEQLPKDLVERVAQPDLQEARRGLTELEENLERLRGELAIAEEESEGLVERHRRAQDAHRNAIDSRQRLESEAATLEGRAESLKEQARIRIAELRSDWISRCLADDVAFVDALERRLEQLKEAPKLFNDLLLAEQRRDEILIQIKALQDEVETILPEHRVAPEQAALLKSAADAKAKEALDVHGRTTSMVRALEESRSRRAGLDEQLAATSRRRTLYERLGVLLGRHGLQAFLIDDAVTGIAQLANETLARLSGGELELRLERQQTRGEEEIIIQACDFAFTDEPLDIAFVSGSQRFRAAVALAAAIGQYAGRGRASVRSLIIDEGFGSLDKQGLQDMIDELRNLAQIMERIVVVSHQPEFQDRALFPTGYVLRKAGRRTGVERFV